MTQYYYIRNIDTGQTITADANSHKYAILKSVNTDSTADLQQWEITNSGHIRSKGTSNNKKYYLTMNTKDEDTHILACLDGDSKITDNQSVFSITDTGGIQNQHYKYFMHVVNDDQSSVGLSTIKVHHQSSGSRPSDSYRWALIPVDHQYGLTFTSKPTTSGGLLAGTVDNALNVSYLRVYVYQKSGDTWAQIGSPITPRPNGAWAVNVAGAAGYGVVVTVKDFQFKTTSVNSFPTTTSGDVLAVNHFTATAPASQYAAQNTGSGPLLTMSNWPFEFRSGQNFTIEMWVQMTGTGALFGTSREPLDPHQSAGVLLGVQDNLGSILFGLSYDLTSPFVTAKFVSKPSLIADGTWHHVAAMRMGNSLLVFLDGTLLAGTQTVYDPSTGLTIDSSQTGGILITNQQYAFVGGVCPTSPNPAPTLSTHVLPYTLPNYCFDGLIDNVRVWGKSLTPNEIRKGMYSPVNNADTDLWADWTFDAQNGADSSVYKHQSTVGDGVTYTNDKVVQPLPLKQSYITAQCKLMDDYFDPKNTKPTAAYQTVLSFWDGDGNRLPGANVYLKADQSCKIWVPQGTSFDDKSIGTTLKAFTTNLFGEFTFSYVAADNLTTPMFSVQADFMASDEWLLIFPDRHAHHGLATVTGDALLNSKPKSSLTQKLKANGVSDINVANSVASAISNFMASALEHDVQAQYPLIWLADEPANNVSKPVPRLYQNVAVSRAAYNPKSNVATTHYTRSGDSSSLQRIVSGDAMPIKNWQFANNRFSLSCPEQIKKTISASKQGRVYLNAAAAVNQAMLDSGKASFTRDEVTAYVRQCTGNTKTLQLYSFSDLWNDIKNAESFAVSVVSHVIKGAKEALHVVSLFIEGVGNYVMQTVTDAVSAIGGLFSKFTATATDIIDFLKATFNWNDILTTQTVVKQYISQVIPALRLQVTALRSGAVSGLNAIQSGVDTYFDRAITSLSGQTFGDTQSRASSGDPQDIQGAYIQRATATYMMSDSSSIAIPTMSDSAQKSLNSAFDGLINNVQADIGTLKTLIEKTPAFSRLFTDPQAFFKASAADVLSILKTLWDVSMDVMRAGVIGIFDVLDSILKTLDDLMKTRIVIPFVTDLYENVINPNHTLNAYDLMALFGAVPLTIAYKLANNNQNPFNVNDSVVQTFLHLTPDQYPTYFSSATSAESSVSQRSVSAKKSSHKDDQAKKQALIKKLSWGLGFLCSGAVLVWGATSFASGKDFGGKVVKTLEVVAVIAEFSVLACSSPIYFAVTDDPLSIFNASIWGTFVIPLIIDAAMLFVAKPTSGYIWAGATTWELFVKPGINVALGVIHGTAFATSAVWEVVNISISDGDATTITWAIANAWFKAGVNVVSIVPELDKVLSFVPQTREFVPLIDAGAFAAWGIGTGVVTGVDLFVGLETVLH